MKVLILKGNAPRHNYFAKEISKIEGVEPIVISFERLSQQRLGKMMKKDFFTFLSRLTKYVIQFLRGYEKKEREYFGDLKIGQKTFFNINSEESLAYIKSVQPDLLVIFGAPIISKRIVEIPEFGAINLHGGISPWYKGGNTIFWPLYKKDFDKIGATIHYATAKVDSGRILARVYPDINPKDSELTVSLKTFRYATEEFCNLVRYIVKAKAAPLGKEQEGNGNLYLAKYRTLWIDIIGHKTIKTNLKNCNTELKIEQYYR